MNNLKLKRAAIDKKIGTYWEWQKQEWKLTSFDNVTEKNSWIVSCNLHFEHQEYAEGGVFIDGIQTPQTVLPPTEKPVTLDNNNELNDEKRSVLDWLKSV